MASKNPKKKPSAYNTFIGSRMRSGMSMAEAQAEWREKQAAPRSSSRENIVPAADGTVRVAGARTLRAELHAEAAANIRFRPDELAALWHGIASQFRETPAGPDPVSLFQARSITPVGTPTTAPAPVMAPGLAQEREVGRQMARFLGVAIRGMGISPTEWAAWYAAAQSSTPAMAPSPAIAGKGDVAWVPPLSVPTQVTAPFAEARSGTPHRGVDLAAPVGSDVRAPAAARVDAVWEEDKGGKCVRLAVRRPDGRYPGGTSAADDSGLLVTFAHLSDVLVQKGQEVGAGQVVAKSGNTGTSTGPHLHAMVQYEHDADLFSVDRNATYVLDPSGVWGPALTGGVVQAPRPNTAIAGLQVDTRTGAASSVPFVVNNSGALLMGNGVLMKDVAPVFNIGPGSGATSLESLRDEFRAEVGRVVSSMPDPSQVVEGVGALAGKFFRWAGSDTGKAFGATGARLTGAGIAGVLGLGGSVATLGGPFLTAIPYVGAPLATIAEVGGPIASLVAPLGNAMGEGLAKVFEGGVPTPPRPEELSGFFAKLGSTIRPQK